ncbi:S26 family signal peptidase [Actinoplanes sp. NPDC051859]|uniref:S26 family signal peptidase n=1 Tax=Actinoplanes sp. NPDC051859 TaxID=3363909 RepID=UPI0037A7F0C9
MRGVLLSLGVVAVAAGVLRRGLVVVDVTGRSMEPTLFAGDRVLIRRRSSARLRRGALIVLELPDDDGRWDRPPLGAAALDDRYYLVKRVVARGGDRTPPDSVPASSERVVPPGTLVVAGDNRRRSLDSRQFGFVPANRVLGVVLVHLPPRRL